MSDRTVLVRLKADTRAFETSMRSAATTTTKLDKEQGKVSSTTTGKADTRAYTTGIKSAETATDKMADAQDDAQDKASRWRGVGTAMTIAGGVIAAGLAKATQAASNQEQALGGLRAKMELLQEQLEKPGTIGAAGPRVRHDGVVHATGTRTVRQRVRILG
ncbi:MAG: hypothetical protein IPH03_11825 [Tetrasphaera sp.]|nr:hypothetical protein [Tetrasphaera sp.]